MKTKNDREIVEWMNELMPPEYDMDCRRRFSPQISLSANNEMVWIETHKFNSYSPIFYTYDEIVVLYESREKNSQPCP